MLGEPLEAEQKSLTKPLREAQMCLSQAGAPFSCASFKTSNHRLGGRRHEARRGGKCVHTFNKSEQLLLVQGS